MTSERFVLRALAPAAAPGLPERVRAMFAQNERIPTAAPRLRDLDAVTMAAGAAWSDPAFLAELDQLHRELGADDSSLEALNALAGGAPCVVTGQQPAVFGGPMYTAWKVTGAIALADELSRRHGRRVVAIHWCGADDSDFDEVRGAWALEPGGRPFRGRLPGRVWQAGQRVGSVGGDEIAAVESAMLGRMGDGGGARWLRETAESFPTCWDLGRRSAAWLLRLFAGRGLVIVDARSPRLLERGRPLFERYAARHRELSALLSSHAEALAAARWPLTLDPHARSSALFVLEGERRRKLSTDELDADLVGLGRITPSVLLRPLWQDEQLAPLVAVLGPGELLYHAQISPLYGALGVEAARPAPRPHATFVPASVPLPDVEGVGTLLSGGEAARRLLAERALPARWQEAMARAEDGWRGALRGLREALDDDGARAAVGHAERRALQEWERLHRSLRTPALRAHHPGWEHAPAVLAVRGVPQERALAATTLRQWWGQTSDMVVDALAAAYVEAVESGRSPTWVLHGGGV